MRRGIFVRLAIYSTLLLLHQTAALKPELLRRILYDEPNQQLQELGAVSDVAGSLERTFLSPAHRQAAVKIQHIMEEAGMDAYIDKVANVRGRVRGLNAEAPILLSGSHYDTVKDAGKFDGMLGILVPIAAVKALLIQAAVEAGKLDEDVLLSEGEHISLEDHLKHSELTKLIATPVEVIAFCEEEGVRFQTTFLGSRAIVGDLIGSGVLEAQDAAGISVRQSLGLTRDAKSDRFLSNLAYKPDQVKAYVEVHMEQGPILEAGGLPLGLVTGIAGQTRQIVMISGTQGHAGTIPMPMRKDPMAAASEVISWVERRCGGGSYPDPGGSAPSPKDALMCTTGSITLWPNAFNVVPGSANFSLDIRSRSDEVWQAVTEDVATKVEEVCKRRGVRCVLQQRNSVNAVYSDRALLEDLRSAISSSQRVLESLLPGKDGLVPPEAAAETTIGKAGATTDAAMSKPKLSAGAYKPPELVSGAGHDALALAKLTKMAMMFVRCRGGHSHSPLEHVAEADVAAAATAMLKFFQAQLLPNDAGKPERSEL